MSPRDAIPIDGIVPRISDHGHDDARRAAVARSLEYIGLEGVAPIEGTPIEKVFIGTCNKGRIEDIREVAAVAIGRKVADGVNAWSCTDPAWSSIRPRRRDSTSS
jgi:homoaconitase/3-isopropylmalate dehydratase large subunit